MRLVPLVEVQQQRVDGEASEPPASLDGAVLQVLGELQHLQTSVGAAAQAQQAPQRQSQLVQDPAPEQGTTSTKEQGITRVGRASRWTHLVLVLRSPLMNSTSLEYML